MNVSAKEDHSREYPEWQARAIEEEVNRQRLEVRLPPAGRFF